MEGADADKLDDKGLLQCLFGFYWFGFYFALHCQVFLLCVPFLPCYNQ